MVDCDDASCTLDSELPSSYGEQCDGLDYPCLLLFMARAMSMTARALVLIALLYVAQPMSGFQKGQVWLAPEPGEVRRVHPPETLNGTEDFDFKSVLVLTRESN